MDIINTKHELREKVKQLKLNGTSINFVPTMGNLHQGHLNLVKKAKTLPGSTIVSIFVNPLQFNQQSDLDAYPRTKDDDIAKLNSEGVDFLFFPSVEEVYPDIKPEQNVLSETLVNISQLAKNWEGESRPGHFDGMATIVAKLFNLVQADVAIFGQKDFQQLQIIKQMVVDLDFPMQIIGEATTRESDGLAMSSRNGRLSNQQRKLASQLYTTLKMVQQLLIQNSSLAPVLKQGKKALEDLGFKIEYLELVDQTSLTKLDSVKTNSILIAAVNLGGVRLIDNLFVKA